MEDNAVSPTSAPGAAAFSAELALLPFFDLALQQNALPVARELKLTNHTGSDLRGVECFFSSSPKVIRPKSVVVDLLREGETLALHDLGIELDYAFLAGISDTVKWSSSR